MAKVANPSYLISAILALFIILMMLVLLRVTSVALDSEDPMQTVRSIELATPPPPPPPPPPLETEHSEAPSGPAIDLNISGGGTAILLSDSGIEMVLQTPDLPEVALDSPEIDPVELLEIDWDTIGLSELDERPRRLTNPTIVFPEQLRRRRIQSVDVELDVFITAQGRVILRRIISNPEPILKRQIEYYIARSRFTAPKKDGIAVRTAFIWPVKFTDS